MQQMLSIVDLSSCCCSWQSLGLKL